MIQKSIRFFLERKINSKAIYFQDLEKSISVSDELEKLILNSPGGWSIDEEVARILVHLLFEIRPNKIVEFGAGYSTLIINYVLENIGKPFELFSIEQNKDWFKVPPDLDYLFSEKTLPLILAPVRFKFGFFGVYARYEIPKNVSFSSGLDLQLVDGPQYYYGREGCLDFTYSKLKKGGLIILDDAERYTEQCLIYKWLKVYKGLDLVYYNEKFGQKGLAILEVKSQLKKRFSFAAFFLGIHQGIKRYLNVKFYSRQYRIKY